MSAEAYEIKCVSCKTMTRHKSGKCEPCRKKERVNCSYSKCKKIAKTAGLCSNHYRGYLRRENAIGSRELQKQTIWSGEPIDPDFDDMIY